MKTMGLIGGMSWKSSLEYYRIVNETIHDGLGGLHSAGCILYSFNFEDIERLQHSGGWSRLAEMMVEAAQALEKVRAEFIVI